MHIFTLACAQMITCHVHLHMICLMNALQWLASIAKNWNVIITSRPATSSYRLEHRIFTLSGFCIFRGFFPKIKRCIIQVWSHVRQTRHNSLQFDVLKSNTCSVCWYEHSFVTSKVTRFMECQSVDPRNETPVKAFEDPWSWAQAWNKVIAMTHCTEHKHWKFPASLQASQI